MDAPGAVPDVAAWEARGQYRTVNGLRIFAVDEGPRDAPVLLLLHGFPSCSFDFWRVLPALTAHLRVIAHDHPGFGLSAKPRDHSYSLLAQADVAQALWAGMGITTAHLLAHDYSTSVAAELFMRAQEGRMAVALDRIVLTNSGFFYDLAKLRPAQHALRLRWLRPLASRLMCRALYVRGMKEVITRRDGYTDAELHILWDLACREHGTLALGWASHYLEERRRIHTQRWLRGLQVCRRPALVLWGDRDPVGVPAIAERLVAELPQAQLQWLHGTGHYPMLESPGEFAAAVTAFLSA